MVYFFKAGNRGAEHIAFPLAQLLFGTHSGRLQCAHCVNINYVWRNDKKMGVWLDCAYTRRACISRTTHSYVCSGAQNSPVMVVCSLHGIILSCFHVAWKLFFSTRAQASFFYTLVNSHFRRGLHKTMDMYKKKFFT